jgi:hypothetical protein
MKIRVLETLDYEELMSSTLRPSFTHGKYANLWIAHTEIVEKTIKKENIKPRSHPVLKGNLEDKATQIGFSGGIRVPHLHLNGEIYILNKEQWSTFSNEVIRDFSKKLAEAKNVSFSQLMELAEPMSEFV